MGAKASEIKWVRASSLFPNAQLVVDGSSKDDVNQGRLGNCWFLAALVGATTIPHIFKKLVPRDQVIGINIAETHFQEQGFDKKQYAGIFHFKFWQYGSWVDVIVDDFLPTIDGELLFVQSDDRYVDEDRAIFLEQLQLQTTGARCGRVWWRRPTPNCTAPMSTSVVG